MPVKQIEDSIQQAQLGHRTHAVGWLRILDAWIAEHRAGVGEGLPATLDQAEDLMRRLREALAMDPHQSFLEGSPAAL
jgi:hypothetical protein